MRETAQRHSQELPNLGDEAGGGGEGQLAYSQTQTLCLLTRVSRAARH